MNLKKLVKLKSMHAKNEQRLAAQNFDFHAPRLRLQQQRHRKESISAFQVKFEKTPLYVCYVFPFTQHA